MVWKDLNARSAVVHIYLDVLTPSTQGRTSALIELQFDTTRAQVDMPVAAGPGIIQTSALSYLTLVLHRLLYPVASHLGAGTSIPNPNVLLRKRSSRS